MILQLPLDEVLTAVRQYLEKEYEIKVTNEQLVWDKQRTGHFDDVEVEVVGLFVQNFNPKTDKVQPS